MMRIINNDKQISISIIAYIMYEDLFFWTKYRDDVQVYVTIKALCINDTNVYISLILSFFNNFS